MSLAVPPTNAAASTLADAAKVPGCLHDDLPLDLLELSTVGYVRGLHHFLSATAVVVNIVSDHVSHHAPYLDDTPLPAKQGRGCNHGSLLRTHVC